MTQDFGFTGVLETQRIAGYATCF